MCYSMTGVGRASGTVKEPSIRFEVEIKSYNHRFLEISIKAPNAILPFEDDMRKFIQGKVTRGHIVVVVQQDREVYPTKIEFDKPLLDAYLKIAQELRKNYKTKGDVDINTLLSIPGLIKFSQTQTDSKHLYSEFKPILEEALERFLQMKKKEGENTAREIKESIKKIETNIHYVEKLIPQRNEYFKEHLLELFKEYQENLSEDRFYQELLYNADRSDVTEECKRLYSHLSLFKEALEDEGCPGRKLNFLLQEMQREANTLSVKANYLEISKAVVLIKEEIEKTREQVQNIE